MKCLVLGAGGFIGSHLVKRLKDENHYVVGADLKFPRYDNNYADNFHIGDLRDKNFVKSILDIGFDEIYQLAADMGGAGFVFTGDNDSDIMQNSAIINLNILDVLKQKPIKIFYSSSACMYPEYNQLDPNNPKCSEDSAYPANPDSEYGWEKLFSERLYLAYKKNYKIPVKIARYHNIFGPQGSWNDGREKAPAALSRKVSIEDDTIEVWGDGKQTRSFLYIDDCVEATILLMRSNFDGPLNIGSEEMITINGLAKMIIDISGKKLKIKNIDGPQGVRGRNSDNKLIEQELNWKPKNSLHSGLKKTYEWISEQTKKGNVDE